MALDQPQPAITITEGSPTILTVPSSLLFDVDSYTLAPGRSQDHLQKVYEFLEQLKPKRIEVHGHTDSTGTPEHNRTLSKKRAEAVAAKLRARQLPSVSTKGHASSRPSCTPEYRNGKPDRVAFTAIIENGILKSVNCL